jgi:hypothetical protein
MIVPCQTQTCTLAKNGLPSSSEDVARATAGQKMSAARIAEDLLHASRELVLVGGEIQPGGVVTFIR